MCGFRWCVFVNVRAHPLLCACVHDSVVTCFRVNWQSSPGPVPTERTQEGGNLAAPLAPAPLSEHLPPQTLKGRGVDRIESGQLLRSVDAASCSAVLALPVCPLQPACSGHRIEGSKIKNGAKTGEFGLVPVRRAFSNRHPGRQNPLSCRDLSKYMHTPAGRRRP